MTYGPGSTLTDILADEQAASIVGRHLPGVFDVLDARLSPFLTVGEMPLFVRGAGEPAVDVTSMWDELAALRTGPVSHPPTAPQPPASDYETSDVPRGSAHLAGASITEKWGVAEVVIEGPSHGNPFVDVDLYAIFRCDGQEIRVGAFYDGDGIYRVRFQPPGPGKWTFDTQSNARSLDRLTGSVQVLPPTLGNHGPVIVRDRFHFAYADATPYQPWGTTAYAWTHQDADLETTTLDTLANGPFTKVRMCVFPKSFSFNANEPLWYPYLRDAAGNWDLTRFDVRFFRHLEERIQQLQAIEVQADLILFHPYDRWGFSRMPGWADDLYTTYVVRRLAALRNVWWSLANEYDFMPHKSIDDWERVADVVQREDHAGHLQSIHNGSILYDYSRPWITHSSIQRTDTYRTTENVDAWRDRYDKPVVIDECGYEGDLEWGWGNITAPELVRRCWEGAVRGGYVTHGETYVDEHDVIWWSKGGVLRGESPPRIGFLARIIAETPSGRFEPLANDWDAPWAGDSDHRVVYFGFQRPYRRSILTPPGTRWNVDVIDTWNMTVDPLPSEFEGHFTIDLPARQYMAIRLRRIREPRGSSKLRHGALRRGIGTRVDLAVES
jgi:hypothetical protein